MNPGLLLPSRTIGQPRHFFLQERGHVARRQVGNGMGHIIRCIGMRSDRVTEYFRGKGLSGRVPNGYSDSVH